jgi:Flp pilus assembly protein TadG
LIWLAMMLTVLLGAAGLVIDSGLIMATQRHAQNAADAAAIAAAHDLMYGKSLSTATASANAYVKQYNGFGGATVAVNSPPTSGGYAGLAQYVQVAVNVPVQTFLIHVLPGVSRTYTVSARGVAGSESVTSGEGVICLRQDVAPGLSVTGGATLRVLGRVVVDSPGGGVDEFGNPVTSYAGGSGSVACAAGGTLQDQARGIYASDIRIVGGVDDPAFFHNYDTDDPTGVLHCRQPVVPDPLILLPTPTVNSEGTFTASGVDPTDRGEPNATNQNYSPNDPSGMNYVRTDPVTGAETVVLYPGIYGSISITGGSVEFKPGIYVLSPKKNTTNPLKITGGTVLAQGIMFYNTGNSYNPINGTPDVNDGEKPPPNSASDLGDGTQYWGEMQFNAGMQFKPIDTSSINANIYQDSRYPGATTGLARVSPDFNGMLFYQRRRNPRGMTVTGNASHGTLVGTIYAKWAHVEITGQGTYNAQFVIGTMAVSGNGYVALNYNGPKLGKAPQVFLVE